MMKKIAVLFLLVLVGCTTVEDCFKQTGATSFKNINITDFTKIKVYNGIEVVITDGPNYEIKVEAGSQLIDQVAFKKINDELIIENNVSCNYTRGYKVATVYITAPNIIEINSKTEQNIVSNGILTYPIIRLFSIDLTDGTGAGDFKLQINNAQTVIESNNIANFYLTGKCDNLLCNFYFGDSRFLGENFKVKKIEVLHRGSNDMYLFPVEEIKGSIFSNGNVILKNNPPLINVNSVYTGQLILN